MKTEWVWIECGEETFKTIGNRINDVFENLKGVLSYQSIFAPNTRKAFVRLEILTSNKFRLDVVCSPLAWAIVEKPSWYITRITSIES